jgi:hypothetical protein
MTLTWVPVFILLMKASSRNRCLALGQPHMASGEYSVWIGSGPGGNLDLAEARRSSERTVSGRTGGPQLDCRSKFLADLARFEEDPVSGEV